MAFQIQFPGAGGGGRGAPAPRPSRITPNLAEIVAATAASRRAVNPQGVQALSEMIASGGRVDPALMNRNIASVSRGTQGAQDALTGSLAGAGLSGSMAGKALGAAIGEAGENRVADIYAQDAADAYARQQGNLGIYTDMIVNPDVAKYGIDKQYQSAHELAQMQMGAAKRAALLSGIGSAIGGFASW